MILSFEIQFPLSKSSASYCIYCLNNAHNSQLVPQLVTNIWSKNEIDSFFAKPLDKSYLLIIDNKITRRCPGIQKLMFIHGYDKEYVGDQFYIRIKVRPCDFLAKEYSENLFCCSSANLEALEVTYAKTIYKLFPEVFNIPAPLDYDRYLKTDEYYINKETGEKIYLAKLLEKRRPLAALPYLGLASVKRVDYAVNLKLPNNFQQFLVLAKRSALDKRKKILFSDNRDKLELKNKSRIFAVYEKVKVTEETFGPDNIIRIKAIVRNPSKEWKRNNLKIDTYEDDIKVYGKARGGLLPFLNEGVAEKLMQEEFNKLVGTGDFYSTYKAWKIIDSSKFKKDKKQNLKDIMQLVSQCWSLQKAEYRYIEGARLKKSRQQVKGTQQTFRRSIKQLRELGLQPLRIPDSWHLSYIHNPISDDISKKIDFTPESMLSLIAKKKVQEYNETKNEIEKMLKARKLN